ncbi:threonine/serine dehydratase [Pyxidicoccus fallax]|uniref:Threonine/serine dehydratase n=3 Tax=Pyxidicoccus fallax TaxID=394095 RepID=A0A848LSQ5_9BACT|nr:threonine/serine dehydratase [Pyxidicoccus fallax]NPC77235.1 threonine/serine dehydratase [Pyxidicoccus fallax]
MSRSTSNASEHSAPFPVTPVSIREARERIAPFIRHTPLEPSPALSRRLGARVFLKLECLQVTGSFKPRISFNKLLSVDEVTRARGAVASTAGGHGIGLSHAARTLGVPVELFLPRTADARKVEVMRGNGARLHFFDSVPAAREAAQAYAREHQRLFVSAYNDPAVIAGGGTVGLEVLDDLPEVDLTVVGIGGGGLISGMGVAMKDRNPRMRLWGVQPEVSPVLAEWLRHGRPVPVESRPSIADGLGAQPEPDTLTLPLARRYVDRVLRVSEADIQDAMAWLLEEHQLVVEPSGAATVAALLRHPPEGFRDVAVVITGRNISRARYVHLLGERLTAASL